MEIYYYCSYTGSPVGYQLGKLDFESGKLNGEKIPQLIRRCFNRGIILNACGRLPGEEKYFLLVKDLTAQKKSEGDADEYYINIAFVTDNWDEFQGLLSEKPEKQSIADAVRDTMSLRGDMDFGFTVCGDRAEKLCELGFGAWFDGISIKDETTYLQVISPQTEAAEIQAELGLDRDLSLIKLKNSSNPGNWFQFSKKKRDLITHPLVIGLLVAVIVGLLVALCSSLGERGHNDKEDRSGQALETSLELSQGKVQSSQ